MESFIAWCVFIVIFGLFFLWLFDKDFDPLMYVGSRKPVQPPRQHKIKLRPLDFLDPLSKKSFKTDVQPTYQRKNGWRTGWYINEIMINCIEIKKRHPKYWVRCELMVKLRTLEIRVADMSDRLNETHGLKYLVKRDYVFSDDEQSSISELSEIKNVLDRFLILSETENEIN